MRQSTKRLSSMALAVVLIIAALIVYFDLTKPTFDDIQAARGDYASRQQILSQQNDAVAQVKKLIGTFQEQGGLQAAASAALPLRAEVSTALAHIAAITAANRMQLQSVALLPSSIDASSRPASQKNSSTTSVTAPASSFYLQVKMTGSYEDFRLFAKDLENNVRIMDVKDILVSPAGRADQDLYRYEIRLKIYYQNSGAASSSDAAASGGKAGGSAASSTLEQ